MSGSAALSSLSLFPFTSYTLSCCCAPDVLMHKHQKYSSQSAAMGFNSTLCFISLFVFIFVGSFVYISARPLFYYTGNNRNISMSCNEGKIGAENKLTIKGKFSSVSLSECLKGNFL